TILEKNPNLGGRPITGSGSTVSIPAIALNANTRFSATIQWANGTGVLTVTGMTSAPDPVSRRVQLECSPTPRGPAILGFGLAAQGPIEVKNSSSTKVVGEPGGDA